MSTIPHVDDFQRTVSGLEHGLLVRSIMSYPLTIIRLQENPVDFFSKHDHLGFDCAPVIDDGRITGMVYRDDIKKGAEPMSASEAMRPLHRVPLVASTEPIAEFINKIRETREHFWLVLDGAAINAIVTRSDLWRLPVRLLAISRIIYLEQLLAALIRARIGDDQWLKDLSPERQQKVLAITEANRKRNEQLDLLESTNFSDKLEILGESLGQRNEKKELGGINALRDQLMHAREGDDAESSVSQFLDRLDRVDRYIKRWTLELHEVWVASQLT